MINRILLAATTALFLLAGAITYAHSEECKIANFTQTVTEVQDAKGAVTEISGKVREVFETKVGPPPGIEGEYKLIRFDIDEQSLIGVVQGDCINLTAGPFQSFILDQLLEVTKASNG